MRATRRLVWGLGFRAAASDSEHSSLTGAPARDYSVPPRFENNVPQNEAERETLVEYLRSLSVQRQLTKF